MCQLSWMNFSVSYWAQPLKVKALPLSSLMLVHWVLLPRFFHRWIARKCVKLPWAPRKQGHQARTLKDYFQQLQLQRAFLHTELHSPTPTGLLLLYIRKRAHFKYKQVGKLQEKCKMQSPLKHMQILCSVLKISVFPHVRWAMKVFRPEHLSSDPSLFMQKCREGKEKYINTKIKWWLDFSFFWNATFHFLLLIIWLEWWSLKQFERRNQEKESRQASSASSCKEKVGITTPSQCSADPRHLPRGSKQSKLGCKGEVWEAAKLANNRL